ncbi:MAG: endonuclease/exonuclease/phosphatase family protein [Clostridia bacterium]|nr:endonuclease/exonuclease/phosphatase family protein [Clostridia bacterium]
MKSKKSKNKSLLIRVCGIILSLSMLFTVLTACTKENGDLEETTAASTTTAATTSNGPFVPLVKEGPAPLSDYRIVYAEGASDMIVKQYVPWLQARIQKLYNVSLEAVSDATEPAEREIVIGDTNRSTERIGNYFEGGYWPLAEYRSAAIAEGGNFYLLGYNIKMLIYAAENMLQMNTRNSQNGIILDTSGEWFESTYFDTKDDYNLAKDADIRIMSYNILHEDWGEVVPTPVAGRDKKVAELLLYYLPDVVGLQEVSDTWHSSLYDILVEPGIYARACVKSNGDANNMTTFLYNPDTVKLVDEYVLDLDNNSNIRVFAVAVFEKLSDGQRFVVTNTHPAPTDHGDNYTRNITDMITLAKQELAKYSELPFIMTGDFNTYETATETYSKILGIGVVDAKAEAETVVNNYGSWLGWGRKPVLNGGSLDHILISPNASSKLYNTVKDNDVQHISDHAPVYADISFNKK